MIGTLICFFSYFFPNRKLEVVCSFLGLDPPICARARQIIPGLLKQVNRLEGDFGRRNFREKLLWMLLIVFLDCDVPLLSDDGLVSSVNNVFMV
ncbi:hypothetical protein PHJA_002938500 [Phtheirospermum japonicum]|uniref:Uncharacterized protein n=1 Tax=Phtheirospermum japonicum TaxID=374723 RepID=A0A830DIF3_9LAMI|nr:hypothetical protein PHJA_002938500 [Phtheirospermum japonicum]